MRTRSMPPKTFAQASRAAREMSMGRYSTRRECRRSRENVPRLRSGTAAQFNKKIRIA